MELRNAGAMVGPNGGCGAGRGLELRNAEETGGPDGPKQKQNRSKIEDEVAVRGRIDRWKSPSRCFSQSPALPPKLPLP